MSHYKKYNLFNQLNGEVIHLHNRYAIQHAEKLYIYDLEGNEIKTANYHLMIVNAINKLIERTKEQGEKKDYLVEYFNLCKQTLSIVVRSK